MRTQEEILARLSEVKDGGLDIFGVIQTDLICALTFENAQPYLAAEATADSFAEIHTDDDEAVRQAAINYLDFAWGKADDERGLSANRSINHYEAWLWLICSDADYERFTSTDYGWYGKGQLAVASELLGVPVRVES